MKYIDIRKRICSLAEEILQGSFFDEIILTKKK